MFTSDEDVALYRDAYSPFWGEPEERLVSAAVAPDTTEQVSQIVKIANRYRIPLFAISTGKNLGYGGSAGNISGTVIVDLKRMNRVIEVDDERYFAIVEPGVAYFDLYRHIQDRQLKVWIDCPDPGWGSVVGNSLDHGVGYTYGAYRDHFHSHCGLEVVMPDGEIVRTGMGALPGSKTWGEYRYGFGPTIDGLFAQGNVGIVTKMGFHLLPAPEAYQTSTVTVPKRRDLIPLVKIVNELEYAGAIGMPQYGSPLGGFGPPNPALAALLNRPSNPSDEELDQYAAQQNRPYWRCELQWYGPASVIATQMEYAKARLRTIPGAAFTDGPLLQFPLTAEQLDRVHKVAIGVPNMAIFSIGARSPLNPSPSDGHLWFSPIIPKSGEAILEAQRVFMDVFRQMGMPSLDDSLQHAGHVDVSRLCLHHGISRVPQQPCPEQTHARRIRPAHQGGCRARLGRIPDTSRLPGRRDVDLQLQQSRAAARPRNDQRRARSQRHPRRRPGGDLAKASPEGTRMKTIASATLALLLLASAGTANAQNRTAVDTGRELYQYLVRHLPWTRRRQSRNDRPSGEIRREVPGPAGRPNRPDCGNRSFLCAARRLDHAVLSQDGSERRRPGCHRRVFDASAGRLAISARWSSTLKRHAAPAFDF